MIEANWVRPETREVHLRVLISIVFGRELEQAKVLPETIGVTLGDIAVLASLVWPDGNWWWSDFIQRVSTDLSPILHQQHVGGCAVIQRHTITDVTDANFESWLAAQAQCFGGEWLVIGPSDPTAR